ncbi:MAG: YdcF family protein [Oscillospiraceae bacterium]|nr:YdcF family protein [Oscillospiraceae bacterium]
MKQNHHFIRKISTVLTTAVLLGSLNGCSNTPNPTTSPVNDTAAAEIHITAPDAVASRSLEEIIQDIVTYHGCYGDEADAKVDALIEELRQQDSRQGELWKNIMDYWKYANTELPVNTDQLPEGLPDDNTMALAVLGFELNDDGTMQDELIGRLTVALNCAQQYPNAYVICTGGGTAKNNPDVTEGGLMGEWMLEHGLDESRLIIEDKSRTTAENASNSYDILLKDYPQVNSVVLISSSYHIAWGSLLFESAFLKSASEKQTPEIHVISNCSCQIENDIYLPSEILRWETGGMLQMIGNNDLAMQYYFDYDNVEKPAL